MKLPEVRLGDGGKTALGGMGDSKLQLCIAVSLWNEKDPILKERYFGLTGNQGNHGEDVKELYYFLDATPTHSYLKMLYKYPQAAFPMSNCLEENARRGKTDPEYEIQDTGIFNEENISMYLLNMPKHQRKIF